MIKKIGILLFAGFFLFLSACKNESGSSTGTNTAVSPDPSSLKVPRFNRDSAYAYIQKQVDFGPRVPGSEAHQACKDWLVGKLNAFNWSVSQQDFDATVYTGEIFPSTNIFAQLRPENPRRLLLGAHWDSRHIADSPLSTERREEPILGADDGGSGVGVLLEIARLLAQDTSLDIGIDIVLFDIEDYGESGKNPGWALGAQYWSQNLPYSGGVKPEYGLLLDMVGAKGAKFFKEQHSIQHAPNLVDKIWRLAGYMGYSNFFINQHGGAVQDDHYYVNTVAKIPMVDIINQSSSTVSNFGAHWHTHDDNMDIIDRSTLRAVGNIVLQVIYREDANVL